MNEQKTTSNDLLWHYTTPEGLTHLLEEPYARYETISIKGRNKEDVRRFYLMGLGE
jgi:hypothetical protein